MEKKYGRNNIKQQSDSSQAARLGGARQIRSIRREVLPATGVRSGNGNAVDRGLVMPEKTGMPIAFVDVSVNQFRQAEPETAVLAQRRG